MAETSRFNVKSCMSIVSSRIGIYSVFAFEHLYTSSVHQLWFQKSILHNIQNYA